MTDEDEEPYRKWQPENSWTAADLQWGGVAHMCVQIYLHLDGLRDKLELYEV